MQVEVQENLITDLWQNNLWLFGTVEGKDSRSDLIWGLCWRTSSYTAKKEYAGNSGQKALEKTDGLGRRWILRVFAAWQTIMVKSGSSMRQGKNNSNNMSLQRHYIEAP